MPKLGSALPVTVEIAFVDKTQPSQGQHLVHCVDVLGSTRDQLCKTASGHSSGPGAEFGNHAFEDAVDQAYVTVIEADLNIVDSPGSDDLCRLFDIDSGKPGSSGEERTGRDAEARSDCAAEKLPLL